MRPVPTSFHVGPLVLHTYGFGLAIAFYVAYRYLVHRCRRADVPTDWLPSLGVGTAIAALVGARVFHVLTNLSQYTSQPQQVLEVWHGGLASFGGLLFAVPTALYVAHRRCPQVGIARGLDLAVAPMALGWSIGRFLGPQLMVAGGGHRTSQWFGMYYAGQAGRRIPVPLIQGLEDGALFCLLLLVERRLRTVAERHAPAVPPAGALTAVAMVVWGLVRAMDERLWLGQEGHLGSVLVQLAGVALAVWGLAYGLVVLRRWRAFVRTEPADQLASTAVSGA